jgi:hypothetical protein
MNGNLWDLERLKVFVGIAIDEVLTFPASGLSIELTITPSSSPWMKILLWLRPEQQALAQSMRPTTIEQLGWPIPIARMFNADPPELAESYAFE